MQFILSDSILESKIKISFRHKIMTIGSCFSDEIGKKFTDFRFNCLSNPSGVLFNPMSIAKQLEAYIQKTSLPESNFVLNQSLWHSFMHHGSLSNSSLETIKENIANTNNQAHDFLKDADVLFITFGSAHVYTYLKSNEIVSNCHKIPSKEFSKRCLKSSEIVETYNLLLDKLKEFNPKIKIIFTLSPVRYIGDGLEQNAISKAILLSSIYEIIETSENATYFPAYELIMDVLRDYRFFKTDLIHPNSQAVEFVWERLMENLLLKNEETIYSEIDKINRELNHKSLHQGSEEDLKFKKHLKAKLDAFHFKYPFLRNS